MFRLQDSDPHKSNVRTVVQCALNHPQIASETGPELLPCLRVELKRGCADCENAPRFESSLKNFVLLHLKSSTTISIFIRFRRIDGNELNNSVDDFFLER